MSEVLHKFCMQHHWLTLVPCYKQGYLKIVAECYQNDEFSSNVN